MTPHKLKHFSKPERLLIAFCLVILLGFAAYRFVFQVETLDVQVIPSNLVPDGNSTVTVVVIPNNALGFRTPFVSPNVTFEIEEGKEKVEAIPLSDSLSLRLRAKFQSGEVVILVRTASSLLPIRVVVPIMSQITDTDGDGFPDAVELTSEEDRRNFRRWFVTLTESQFYREDDFWRTEDRDCAGMIRFAYREAMKKHTNEWFARRRFLTDMNIPDVKKYNYPSVPLIEERIFRTTSGSLQKSDLKIEDSVFINYVDAAHLKDYNLFF
jgi:uncharacterized protein YfaT (DUF1175 family)